MAVAPFATCIATVIDPAGSSCVAAQAGHLPPVLVLPGGATRVLDLPPGLPLGLGAESFAASQISLPPGATLALYTDGLVESRTRSFDHGILAMRSILAREHGHLEAICDALIASLAGRCEDDITVILARIPGGRAG
jgi:serine phosphatase RsbU (regulator of sigma subunit)